MNFEITNVIPNQNYELSFWAANSEPNGTPNRVNAVVDGIVSFSTGLLQPVPSALPWQKYGLEMRQCALSSPGVISGQIYSDVNGNNIFDENSDGSLANIEVQLFDTQGTNNTADDIFISVTGSGPDGIYQFTNLPANPDYQLRVVTTDDDLPAGASPGTAAVLNASLASGGDVTGLDFGFDLSNAKLEAEKIVSNFDPSGYSIP